MDIITITKDLFKCKSLQEFVNRRFKDDNIFRFYKDKFLKNIEYLTTPEGIVFKNSSMVNNIILRQYNYDGLTKDDVVLVLGACEGDCLVFSNKVKHIIAVEPLHHAALRENIARNHIQNITVLECGLGKFNGEAVLQYEGIKKQVQLYTMTEIIIRSNLRPNVLICDVEGYEHSITTQELKQFHIIEMESHVFGRYKLADMRQKLIDAGFDFTITEPLDKSEIIHAKRRINNEYISRISASR